MTSTIDEYQLSKTLGEGFSAKVKLATGPDGKQYALKIFDLSKESNSKNAIKYMKEEVAMTMNLSHKNIVKYHDFKESTTMTKANGSGVKVAYIAQEPVLGGELFDFIANGGELSEPICRYYFK